MPKQIIIAEQHRIAAVFSEDQIQELVVATGRHQVSDIYLGVVENVLPGIDAAFVNIGDSERNGFIHVTDLGPLKLKRTAGAITELLAPQQKVLVQVMKEPTGNKGPRLTGNITLPSRYVVLMPFGRGVNLSQRIKSESERNRLRALAILIKPAGMGLLIRTEAEGKPEDAIIEDLEAVQKQWEAVQQEALSIRAPALLNRDDDFIQRVLRDMYGADVNRIVVDSTTGVKRVKQYLMNWSGGQPAQGLLIDQHRDRIPVMEYFRVNAAIREALKRRVDLPSGGYVIIEPTEALTVIDVNSGSFTRSATARETVLWTNCEAATEIARQLRLRNIAGVIVVDFIDMELRRDQLQVLEHFNKALKADKAKPQIAQLSELGLVELTRKRQGQNIYELFGRSCPTCGGSGHIVHLPGEPESHERDVFSTPPRVEKAVGETADWSANQPTKEHKPTLRLPETRETSEDFRAAEVLGFDSGVDAQNLNLLNHPSYHELGDSNNNRRRRRRQIGTGEIPAKDETRMPVKEIILANQREPEVDSESETLELSPVTGKSSWTERGERTKPTKSELVKPVEPPEIVHVPMTPEEQDVYAQIGVSPLVRLNHKVKNPKSVIINVTLPGEAPSTDIGDENEIPISESTNGESDQPILSVEPALESSQDTDDSENSPVAVMTDENEEESTENSPVAVMTDENEEESTENSPVAVMTDENEEESTSSVPARRRRRRSSAT